MRNFLNLHLIHTIDEQLDISEIGDMLSKNCFPELEGIWLGRSALGRLESVCIRK